MMLDDSGGYKLADRACMPTNAQIQGNLLNACHQSSPTLPQAGRDDLNPASTPCKRVEKDITAEFLDDESRDPGDLQNITLLTGRTEPEDPTKTTHMMARLQISHTQASGWVYVVVGVVMKVKNYADGVEINAGSE